MGDSYPGWSPYNYVLDNPLLLVDPNGECPPDEEGGCLGWLGKEYGSYLSFLNDRYGFKNPVTWAEETYSSVKAFVSDPGGTLKAVASSIQETAESAIAGDPEAVGKVTGLAMMAGVEALASKGLGTLGKATEAVDVVQDAGSAYHYTAMRNASSIMSKGLTANREGNVYATTNAALSPLQAQIDLAFPPNRPLPGALFHIELNGLRQAGVDIVGPRNVSRMFNMPGGGQEILIRSDIPPQFLTRIK